MQGWLHGRQCRGERRSPLASRAGPAVRAGLAVLAWFVALPDPCPAQSTGWDWLVPRAAPATAEWRPEVFADFLSSGQPPHPAVVRIVAPEGGGTSIGSGVLVDVNPSQGLVLTNWHVIRGASSAVLVQFPDGFQSAGRVIRHDEPWDLAAVAIWRPKALPVPLAAAPPVIGEPLTIAGYGKGPFRSEAGPCTQYLAPGAGYPLEFVELQATARQGDSGGPILNARGELAGILFGRAEGRTIGACSTRVRAFLADVGSRGLSAEEVGALAAAAGPAAPPVAAPMASLPRPGDVGPAALAPPPPGPPDGALTPAPSAPLSSAPVSSAPQPMLDGPQAGFPGPQPVPVLTSPVPPPAPVAPPPPTWGDFAESRPRGQTLRELLDPAVNGRAIVVGVGGVLLALVGVRTIFGRGGRREPPRRRYVEVDDD